MGSNKYTIEYENTLDLLIQVDLLLNMEGVALESVLAKPNVYEALGDELNKEPKTCDGFEITLPNGPCVVVKGSK